jgi:GrpB-like predicted nucleotidyltransferase (UPF0157 family)
VKTLEERVEAAVREAVVVVPYDPAWPEIYKREKSHLIKYLHQELIGRIEHFGSTAIPGMSAKPIIDMLIEVTSLEATKKKIAPLLEAQGYDYFWRPSWGDDIPPFYAFFIKRDATGNRTHHIHMVEADFEHWDRLLFRDYLIERPDIAEQYRILKSNLARDYPNDRIAYTQGKTKFIVKVTQLARDYYKLRSCGVTAKLAD